MSHLICVFVHLSSFSLMWASHEWDRADPVNVDSIQKVHIRRLQQRVSVFARVYLLFPLTHTSGLCVRITGNTSCFCESHQTAANLRWQRGTEAKSPWNIKQKLPWRRLLFIYIHLKPKAYQMWQLCCSFLSVCFSCTHQSLITSAWEWDSSDCGLTEGKAWPNWFQVAANILSASH